MGKDRKKGEISRPSTAPPERSRRPSRKPTSNLAPVGEAYESLSSGYPQGGGYPSYSSGPGGSGSQQYQSIDELYNSLYPEPPQASSSQGSSSRSSSSKHGKKSSRRSATPGPGQSSSYRSPGSSSSSRSGPPPSSSSSYYIDAAESAAMKNTSLYGTDGTMNPLLAPFVATGLEGVEEEPEQQWIWNPLLNRYVHQDERSQQVMFLPKPDSFQ